MVWWRWRRVTPGTAPRIWIGCRTAHASFCAAARNAECDAETRCEPRVDDDPRDAEVRRTCPAPRLAAIDKDARPAIAGRGRRTRRKARGLARDQRSNLADRSRAIPH